MHLTIAPKGILQIDDARIVHRNFAGRGDKYNREGDRNFSVVIEDMEVYDALLAEGWNVKLRPGRTEDEAPFMFLPVKVKFNDRGPGVYLISGSRKNELSEDSVACLDEIDIATVDLDIRPYDWVLHEGTKNEKRGRTAYLQGIHVIQEIDRFAARWEEDQ